MRAREIRVREIKKITEKRDEPHEDVYMQIKPESDISTEDCDKFWTEVFTPYTDVSRKIQTLI